MEDADNAESLQSTSETVSDVAETVEESKTETPAFTIPKEYENSGWAKNIKSYDDLFKSYANAQVLIGKKAGDKIPDFDNADDAQLQEFYGKTRPKEMSEYETADLTDDLAETTRKLFYDNGLNKKQANAVLNHFTKIMKDESDRVYGEDGFKAAMTKHFGEDWVSKTSKSTTLIRSVIGEDVSNDILSEMTNEGIATMYKVVDAIMKKYAANDSDFATAPKTEAPAKMTPAEFYQKMKDADRMPNNYEIKQTLMKQYYGE